ncbi:vWA domain-containing protein [Nocardia seriolae]|uniref:vWA domain-containing protein n=1 Tax=Nocardia seriolae TaxID=37332 RepID=UPI00051A6E9C|nr:VWA domain-containing protein [Nocardia seriolae]MTJ63622.1 stress protein [Nocardia seriolae]MTJ74813.1 stress protein [Nocardia seriolae]MTJ88193.1 stress protein [Nocardia seriolae]MTK32181.1 stress protein [Nocardia seriolae]MTK41522.1 stress protein [Nocardia seriolae]
MSDFPLLLAKGQNAEIPTAAVLIAVSAAAPVDVSALLVTAAGKVRSDADFVFYNQPVAPGVRLVAGTLHVELSQVPTAIAQIRAVITLDDPHARFGSYPPPTATVADASGKLLYSYRIDGLDTESVVVSIELYRRGDGWKVRAVGQGYAGGFADLITDHGVVVNQPAATPTPVPPRPATVDVTAAPAFAPQPFESVRSMPGEEKLSLEKRQVLDLRKREVAKVLLDKGAQGVRARVILVIDKTGSMAGLYKRKVVHQVVERMIPVAIQLDDNGELEPFLYGRQYAKLPNITVEDTERWCATFLHLRGVHAGIDYRHIGDVNDELPIMQAILASLHGPAEPTLVLFFTDGGFHKRREITQLMRAASHAPAFWQFIGLGPNNFGILTALDELDGRLVDNAGFFAVRDIDKLSDSDLYRLLLNEFPSWLQAARRAGILH